jgi:hypothetical protein
MKLFAHVMRKSNARALIPNLPKIVPRSHTLPCLISLHLNLTRRYHRTQNCLSYFRHLAATGSSVRWRRRTYKSVAHMLVRPGKKPFLCYGNVPLVEWTRQTIKRDST